MLFSVWFLRVGDGNVKVLASQVEPESEASVKLRILFVLVMVAVSSVTCAQTANPLDNVPQIMPNDIPYGAPIGLKNADRVLDVALAESQRRTWKEVCAVVDSGGNLVSLKRMDGAQLGSIENAIRKARTSVKYRRETKAFEASVQGGNYYQLTLDDVIASRGGIPLLEAGKLIGAIGCSGGTGSQDEVVAKAGVAALGA
jgi:glc operon protein GlcG